MTNSQGDAHSMLDGETLSSHSGILAEAISIASGSLQQIQPISLTSLLQYPLSEAVFRNCSVKKVFLKILQNSQVFPLAKEFAVNFAKF